MEVEVNRSFWILLGTRWEMGCGQSAPMGANNLNTMRDDALEHATKVGDDREDVNLIVQKVPFQNVLQEIEEIPKKTGYLTKRGFNYPSWKTRFFVLQEAVLKYHSSEQNMSAPLGEVQLLNALMVPAKDDMDVSISLLVKGVKDRFFYMKADTIENANAWRTAISSECDPTSVSDYLASSSGKDATELKQSFIYDKGNLMET